MAWNIKKRMQHEDTKEDQDMTEASSASASASTSSNKLCECCATRMSRTVACPYCTYRACMKCIGTFATSLITDVSCMSCGKAYTHDFMAGNFTGEFMKKTLPAHKKKILFAIEKAMMPQTMPHIEFLKTVPTLREELSILHDEIKRLEDRKHVIEMQIEHARMIRNGTVPESKEDKEKQDASLERIPVSCPIADCRGFLNNRGKCGACAVECCRECHEVMSDNNNHTCNPDILATVKALEKECKKCPKCSIPIFKIDGCDQMWCVKCHTAFNWKTGKVETGRVHNPHYFQYMREHEPAELQRDARDANVACMEGRTLHRAALNVVSGSLKFPTVEKWVSIFTKLLQRIRGADYTYTSARNDLPYVFRLLVSTPDHIQYQYIARLPRQFERQSNMDLRISYILNEIDQKEFEAALLRRQKSQVKLIEYREVMETFNQLLQDCVDRMSRELLKPMADVPGDVDRIFEQFNDEMSKVERFTRVAIDRVNDTYGGRKVRQIGE